MKALHLASPLFVGMALVVSACSRSSYTFVPPAVQTIRGSGVIVEEDRPMNGFSRIDFATIGSLNVQQGAQESLRVRGDDNLLPYITTVVSGDVLSMRTRSGFDLQQTRTIEFALTVVDLNRVDFSGVGSVQMSNLSVNDLSMSSAGVGSIECSTLDAVRLDVMMSGFGGVEVSGQVDEQVVRAGGFGDYDAGGLESREATVTIEGSGSATVRVSDWLEVNLVGSGSVFYIGDPVVTISGSGSGRVQKI